MKIVFFIKFGFCFQSVKKKRERKAYPWIVCLFRRHHGNEWPIYEYHLKNQFWKWSLHNVDGRGFLLVTRRPFFLFFLMVWTVQYFSLLFFGRGLCNVTLRSLCWDRNSPIETVFFFVFVVVRGLRTAQRVDRTVHTVHVRTECVVNNFRDQIYAVVSDDKIDYAHFSHVDTIFSEPVCHHSFWGFGAFAVSLGDCQRLVVAECRHVLQFLRQLRDSGSQAKVKRLYTYPADSSNFFHTRPFGIFTNTWAKAL